MNSEISRKKIDLYILLDTLNKYGAIYDFENFSKKYDKQLLDEYKDILNTYESLKYSDLVEVPPQNIQSFYTEGYLNSNIIYVNEQYYYLQFDFQIILFYELLNYHKNGLIKFIELVKEKLIMYKTEDNIFELSLEIYKVFYGKIDDEEVINAIYFLVKTRTFAINTSTIDYNTKIDINEIEKYLQSDFKLK